MQHRTFSSSLLRIDLEFVCRQVAVFGRELANDPDVIANPAEEANGKLEGTSFPWNLAMPLCRITIITLPADGRLVVRRERGLK